MAAMLGLATGLQVMFAIVTADGTGTTSAGSCYNMTTHAVSCNMAEVDCSSPHMWYSPGYVSPRSGCCHCEASCANTSGNCTYYDALEDPQENWGCYEHAARQCDCLVSEAGCTAKGAGHTWTSGCTSCASQGSCYDMTSHGISCDVPETSCSSPNMWYAPGYVSPRSGCCHCRASCREPADNCTYSDVVAAEPEENWGCYEHAARQCDCLVSEAGCTAKGTGHTWTSGCNSCASQGSCYDMTSHVISCDVPEISCSSPNMWYSPGYVSPRSGCCHCRASCKEPANNCSYSDVEAETQRNWGCYDSSTNACDCDTTEAECSGSWTQSCRSCNGEVSTSSAGRPRGFVLALLVLLYGFFAAEANTGSGTGCYNVETHQCDCTVSESTCHARGGTWTDTCRSCDSTTNEQHPQCQRQYSWGCFDEASHACECTVSERTCEAAAGKTWTHECWSCCHGSSWGCFVPGDGPESGCHCNLHETSCSLDFPDATWSHQCFDCDVDAVPSAAGRPTGFVVALLALLSGFFLSDANTGTGTGCYDTETHRCDCTVTETVCLARQGHWTDTCRSCDATTNEQHPDCQRQYSWGCFDEASHACECTVSERACDAAAGKTWTHECWSCCHGSAWGCFVPGNGPESGCHCNLYEGACALDFPDATWSHQCFECEEDSVQKDVEAAMDDGGVGVAVAVSVSVTVVVIAACIGIYCLWAKMMKPKPVNEPQLGNVQQPAVQSVRCGGGPGRAGFGSIPCCNSQRGCLMLTP